VKRDPKSWRAEELNRSPVEELKQNLEESNKKPGRTVTTEGFRVLGFSVYGLGYRV
jgi:hypothetical protein